MEEKMGFIKTPSGEYYYRRRHFNGFVFIIKQAHQSGALPYNMSCPKELIGKKVRLKLEVVEDERKN
jgi:hypothetical protein